MKASNVNLRTVAIVLAGGTGQRMGMNLPKQLLKVAGRPIIEHTLDVLQSSEDVDEIIVLMTPEFIKEAETISAKFSKVAKVLKGGDTRSATTKIALDSILDHECKVIFHDAVRPLVSRRIISDCVNALNDYQAIDVAIPSADTIIEVENGIISNIPDRSRLMRGQTPQGFLLSIIRQAYELAWKDDEFQATDDCGVVSKYLPDVAIGVINGAERNMKVTHPIDIHILDKLFQLSTENVETPDDEMLMMNLKGKTIVIFGGSYGIGESIEKIAKDCGANVYSYSRSTTGTHIERTADVHDALESAVSKAGSIDYVINTAGLLRISSLEGMSEDDIKELITVNYTAPIFIAQAALPYLRKTKGQLLLFTSSSYTRGRADYSLYSSSKAAIVNLTQALADEWGSCDVRINCINPERTATPMRTRAFGKEHPDTLLHPDVVAKASLATLAKDVTGQVFDIRRN